MHDLGTRDRNSIASLAFISILCCCFLVDYSIVVIFVVVVFLLFFLYLYPHVE